MAVLHSSVPRLRPFKACKAKAGTIPQSHYNRRPHRHLIRAAVSSNQSDKTCPSDWAKALRIVAAGTLASSLLWVAPLPAEADMQMVSPQMVTQMARPLPKQTVDKGKIWGVFIGGAICLFGITLAAENNESLFPAITRANKAFRQASAEIDEMEERQRKEEELLRLRQAQYDEEQRQLSLVKDGMRDARAQVLGTEARPAQEPAVAAAAAAAAPLAEAQPSPAAEADIHTSVPSSSAAGTPEPPTPSTSPYVVVDDVLPDMGAVAWPAAAATAGEPSAAGTSAHAEQPPPTAVANGTPSGEAASSGATALEAEDAESMARLSRLQGFVSGTMAGGMSPLEAYKAQRQ